jgi:hypothetical protein
MRGRRSIAPGATTRIDVGHRGMSDGEKDESMFAFNPDARVDSVRVGGCPIAVTVADNVLLRPQQLAEFGLGLAFGEDESNLYPGVRARVPAEFSQSFHAWLTRTLHATGVLEESSYIYDDASFFSIVNKSRADLLPLQRIPHYDSTDPTVFAAVIYLFDRANSGTSFYRHRTTGYERIGGDNAGNYRIALSRNMKQFGPPARDYANGSNALFERTHSVDSVFNRIVVYSGNVLHAADIDGSLFSGNDNGRWRLTISSLINST